MVHFKLLSPKRRCQRHVPAANEAEAEELFEELLVDDELFCLLKDGRLRLRWPLLKLRPLSLFLWPPRLTKFMSVSSSSLKAGVKDDAVAVAAAAGAAVVDEAFEDEVMWLMGFENFSVGRPCRSKKSSACFATCSAVKPSTSLPIISLIRGGIDLRTCSLRI